VKENHQKNSKIKDVKRYNDNMVLQQVTDYKKQQEIDKMNCIQKMLEQKEIRA
jgi:hypothetical protein